MVLFIVSVLDQKYLFYANLVQNIKIVSLRWNLLSRLIRICKIISFEKAEFDGDFIFLSFFLFFFFFAWDEKSLFWTNLFQKIKIFRLSWNLLSRLIWICGIQWVMLTFLFFPFSISLFRQIWSKKSKLPV